MPAGAVLRERQAEQVRSSIVDAAIEQLEQRPLKDISMADVAADAGVSLRTLYRYFPDRAALLSAAGEHLYGSLGIRTTIGSPDEVATCFLDAAQRLATRPALARTLVQTTAGRTARSAVRQQRVESIRTALRPLTENLDADTARRITAVIAHLCSAASWIAVSDDSGIDDHDAQHAVAWAIDTLIQSLRAHRAEPVHSRPGRRDTTPTAPRTTNP